MSLELSLNLHRGDFRLAIEHSMSISGITAIFGPSGSGKTSLLRAIAGLERVSGGQLIFNQQVWQNEHQFLAPHKRQVAYVFQEASLFDHLSVRQNIEYAYSRVPKSMRRITSQQAISALGVEPLLNRHSHTLSGGERQRVAIARAVCSNPQLMLMDEPLSALDIDSKQAVLPIISSLYQHFGIPIIYVSHALSEVARIADHLLLLNNGRLQASGDIQSMLTQLDLSLARDSEAESLINAVVAGHDDLFHLSYLDSPIGRFSVSKRSENIGQKVRVLIAARDISITLQHQQDTSILNIFKAEIAQIDIADGSQLTIKLVSSGVPLLARLTKKSASIMNLKPGDSVFVQVKSVAIL